MGEGGVKVIVKVIVKVDEECGILIVNEEEENDRNR